MKPIGFVFIKIIVAAILLHGVSSPATAGPPFVTDDPEPVDLYHWEFYIASGGEYSSSGVTATAPHFEVNFGAFPDIQLHMIAPLVYFDNRDEQSSGYGYGNTELGIKWRFINEGRFVPQIGTFVIVELPAVYSDFGSTQTQVFIPLWIQKSIGSWQTYGGGGFWYNPGAGNKNYWFFGWQMQYNFNDNISLGAEVFFTTPDKTDSESVIGFNAGGILNFNAYLHLLFSAGKRFKGDDQYTSYLAVQFTI